MSEITVKQKTVQKKKRGNPQNLIPFKKGQSGNPKGRPKKGSAIADLLNEIGDELIEFQGQKITKKKVVMMKVFAAAVKGESWAVHFLADRTEGKALERIKADINKDDIEIL